MKTHVKKVCIFAGLLTTLFGLVVSAAGGKTPLDFTGDGRSDYAIIRPDIFSTSTYQWWIADSASAATTAVTWGVPSTDTVVTGDFDGDGKVDIAVWRSAPVGSAGFYIIPSSTGVAYFVPFGQTGDDPRVVADYDGDGRTDLAVYRESTQAGASSFWWYRSSMTGATVAVPWGQAGDRVAPGDYDGDGRADFAIRRDDGAASLYYIKTAAGAVSVTSFGVPSDMIATGDFDGDGKTDLAIIRLINKAFFWYVQRSSDGQMTVTNWGYFDNSLPVGGFFEDVPAPADYDGDGITDIAVWAKRLGPAFVVKSSKTGDVLTRAWGEFGGFDYPLAAINLH